MGGGSNPDGQTPFASKRGDSRRRVTADPPRRGRAEAETRQRCFPPALQRRELDGAAPRPAGHLFSRTLFCAFRLREQWDLCPGRGGRREEGWPPPSDPSAVSEILAHSGLVVALTDAGQCVAYRVGRWAPPEAVHRP